MLEERCEVPSHQHLAHPEQQGHVDDRETDREEVEHPPLVLAQRAVHAVDRRGRRWPTHRWN